MQTDLSPVADFQAYLEEDSVNMDPDLLDREMDDPMADTFDGSLATTSDAWFAEFEAWLGTVPEVVSFNPAAEPSDEDEMMPDVGLIPPSPLFDSDDDDDLVSETQFFVPGILRDSSLEEDMAFMTMLGNDGTSDTEVEPLTAALAQLTLALVEDMIMTEEQQQPQEDVDMAELQKPIPPVIVIDMMEPEEFVPPIIAVDMTEPEEPIPPTDDMLELNGLISPVIDMTEPEELVAPLDSTAMDLIRFISPVIHMTEPEESVHPTDNTTELNGPTSLVIDMTEPEEPVPPTVNNVVPDAVPDLPLHAAFPPLSPYMGEDDEDWNEQVAVPDAVSPPASPTSTEPLSELEDEESDDDYPSRGVSPGPSLIDELEAALLGCSPTIGRSPAPSRSPSPSVRRRQTKMEKKPKPLWAFPPDMVDNSDGDANHKSLNELFNIRQTIEEGKPFQTSKEGKPNQEDRPKRKQPQPKKPLWAFPDSAGGTTNKSLNELFNVQQTIEERHPTGLFSNFNVGRTSKEDNTKTGGAPDDLSEKQPVSADPTPEDHTQTGSSKSPSNDAAATSTTLTTGADAKEQRPVTKAPVSDPIPAVIVTPAPKRTAQVDVPPIKMGGLILPGGNLVMPTTPDPKRTAQDDVPPIKMGGLILPGGNLVMPKTPEPKQPAQDHVAPIRMGGLLLPGGNLVMPTTPAPVTPMPQPAKKPDPEALRKKKEESLARDLRNVLRRRQQASTSMFVQRKPQKDSLQIRSPDAAERDSLLRSPQNFAAFVRGGSSPGGAMDTTAEDEPALTIASPSVMREIRASEALRGDRVWGNIDERA